MQSKRPGKRAQRSPRKRPESQPRAAGLLDHPFLSSPWAPVLFFALLSIVYFAGFVFSDNLIRGLDTGQDYHRGNEPFLRKLENWVAPQNWDRYLGGTPMTGARQWQYFPLHVVSLFTSHHRYLGWRYLFAMFSAGYFMFLCIRGLGLRPLTALLTGVAYASAPTLMTFIFAGQEAKMLVIGLYPLMVWGLYRGLETKRPVYFLILAAGIGAGVYTPHLQLLFYGLWGLGLIFLFQAVHYHRREKSAAATARRSLLSAGAVCLGLAVGAVGIFPVYWYTATQSTRAGGGGEGVGIEYAQSWSLHPEEIASLAVPEFVHFAVPGGQNYYWGRNPLKLNSEYFGIAVLFFAALALGRTRKDPRVLLFLLLALFALAFSLGPHTPLHGLLYRYVPGMKVLRVPGMIAFLFAFPACCLAALGLDRLFDPVQAAPHTLKRITVGTAAGLAVLLFLALAPGAALNCWTAIFWPDIPSANARIARANLPSLGRGALLVAAVLVLIFLLARQRIRNALSPAAFAALLLPLMLLDTWRIDKQFLKYVDPDRHPPAERLFPDVVNLFRQDRSLYRTLVLPQILFPDNLVDLVVVFHHEPFMVQRYSRITGDENLNHLPILNLLNTKYIVSQQPMQAPGMSEALSANGLHVYRNAGALPWFYLAPDYLLETEEGRILTRLRDPEFDPARTAVLETRPDGFTADENPDVGSDRIEQLAYDERAGHIELRVRATGPRLLVVSENYHPFWRAYVDGEERPLLRANYVWKAVPVPAGEHRVELRFRDPIAAACRWVSLLSALGLVAALAWFGRSREAPDA